MKTFGKIGEEMRGMVTAVGLGLSAATLGATAATAQEVHGLTRTTFSSTWEAGRYAQSQGMVLARAYNGEMRFVSQELARLLDDQGFEMRQGILYGYSQKNFGEFLEDLFSGNLGGYNFANSSQYLGANSTIITIESSQGGGERDNDGDDDDDGCSGGCHDEV